jgi:hypothetical protein
VVAIFPRLSALADRITVEDAMLDEQAFVRTAMAPHGVSPEVVVVSVEPTAAEIADAAQRAAAADATVLCLYDAHLYASNRALLDAVSQAARALGVVLLRDPWDAALVAPPAFSMTAFGWRRCQVEAVLGRLLT